MILVDTSVWIRFILNRAPYAAELQRLLLLDQVLGHELVFGELLIGDNGSRREFLLDYERIHQVQRVPHKEAVEFVRQHKLCGRGVGWIDVNLLASAIVGGSRLWTADARLAGLAKEFNLDYDPAHNRPFLI